MPGCSLALRYSVSFQGTHGKARPQTSRAGIGTINLGDVLYIQRFTGEEVNAGTALFDVNLDGMLTTIDMLVVKDGVTSPPLHVACP